MKSLLKLSVLLAALHSTALFSTHPQFEEYIYSIGGKIFYPYEQTDENDCQTETATYGKS
jgi:opacity protein-like surface antigen